MKRRILSVFLVFAMLLSTLTMLVPAFAADVGQQSAQADESAGKTYIWTFSGMANGDPGNAIATTSEDANTLVWAESTKFTNLVNIAGDGGEYTKAYEDYHTNADITLPEGTLPYYAQRFGTVQNKSILEDYKDNQKLDWYELLTKGKEIRNGKLAAFGGYFKLQNSVTLEADKPWKIELSGIMPNGTRILSNDDGSQYIAMRTTGFIIYNMSTNNNSSVQNLRCVTSGDDFGKLFNVNTAGGGANGRLGQNRIVTIVLSNEYDEEKNEWYIHFTYGGKNPQRAGEYVFDNTTDTFGDLTFTSIGSNDKPFAYNDNSSNKFQPYFDYINIYEEFTEKTSSGSTTWDFSNATLSNGSIANTGGDSNVLKWVETSTPQMPVTNGLTVDTGNPKYYAVKPRLKSSASYSEASENYDEIKREAKITDNALVAFGGYFKLQNTITLEADKPWSIEISGRIANNKHFFIGPKGEYIRFDTDQLVIGNVTTGLVSNRAYKDGVVSTTTQFDTYTFGGHGTGGRIGQHTCNTKITIYNKQDEDGTWYIWFDYSGSPRGEGSWKFANTPTSTLGDLTFNSIGSATNPLNVNSNWSPAVYLFPYLDYIKIDEDCRNDSYEWDFSEMAATAEINTVGSSISTTSGDENLLKWNYASKNATTYSTTEGGTQYYRFTGTDYSTNAESFGQGYQIKNGMLSVCDGYFNLANSITLEADKPWRIELSGLVANSAYLFSNDDQTQYINFDAKAIKINSKDEQVMKDSSGSTFSGRLGQQKGSVIFVLSNEYDETTGKWYIHFTQSKSNNVATIQGPGHYVFANSTDTFGDLTFTSIGSKDKRFNVNDNGGIKYQPYFEYIRIYEYYQEGYQETSYEWDFSGVTSGDASQITTTAGKANTMLWKVTADKPTMLVTEGLDTTKTDGKYYAIKPSVTRATKFDSENISANTGFMEMTKTAQILDDQLVAFGGYFNLSKNIVLEADKPWVIEIKGRIQNGQLFAGPNGESISFASTDYFTIKGASVSTDSRRAFKYENGEITSKVYFTREGSDVLTADGITGNCNGRFGQSTINQYVKIYNKQDADGTWYIWFDQVGRGGAADGSFKFTAKSTSEIGDLTFSSIGSLSDPFDVNTNSNTYRYFPYLDYIKINEDTSVTVTDESLATMVAKNLVLNEDIKYQFLYELSDDVLNDPDAYMQISVNGTVKKININGSNSEGMSILTDTQTGKTYYKFFVELCAKEMSDVISLQVFSGNKVSTIEKWSVKDYAKIVLNRADLAKAQPLVKAMLNYGAAAQTNFDHRADILVNLVAGKNYAADMPAVTADELNGYSKAALNSGDYSLINVDASNVQLVLEDKIIIKVAIAVKDRVAAPVFKYGETVLEATPYTAGGVTGYIVSLPAVVAKDFDEKIAITVESGDVSETFNVSVLTYCHTVLAAEIGGTITENLQNTVKAIYLYNKAANTYFAQ